VNQSKRFTRGDEDFVAIDATTEFAQVERNVVDVWERDLDAFNEVVVLDDLFADLEHCLLNTMRVMVGEDVQERLADGVVRVVERRVPDAVPLPLCLDRRGEDAVFAVAESTVFVAVEVCPLGASSLQDGEADDASPDVGVARSVAADFGLDPTFFCTAVDERVGMTVFKRFEIDEFARDQILVALTWDRHAIVQVLSQLDLSRGDVVVLAKKVTAKINSEGFRIVARMIRGDGVASVFDGVGGDDVAIVAVNVGVVELAFKSNSNIKLHNFVKMSATFNFGKTNFTFAVRIGGENRSFGGHLRLFLNEKKKIIMLLEKGFVVLEKRKKNRMIVVKRG
jgi:hypothetical protein